MKPVETDTVTVTICTPYDTDLMDAAHAKYGHPVKVTLWYTANTLQTLNLSASQAANLVCALQAALGKQAA